ncbi:MAG TPA: transglutaminase-like domain-containing protein, partial [Pyrinomonadaceae bacterium]|nr:transglutaminase-like domain-containing protein [Pyrinomonadaceae bacterium]
GPTADEVLGKEIRDTTVMMLAQPSFSGEDFRQQILGNGRLVKYVRSLKDAYFTYPKNGDEDFNKFLAKYFIDKSKIEYAKDENGQAKLGGYTLNVPADQAYFFRTTLDNIQIEPRQNLSFQLKDATYEVSLTELRNLGNNSELYGGKLIARIPERRDGPQFVFANHGIMVAKPGEPSLKRLADELLKSAGPSREERIQRLVDFVSNDIDYSFTEAVGTSETLKRASETLMTRSGDCSNKTILLASLLEQIGEAYVLLYCPQHITVAVPQGNFSNENNLDFTWNQKPWVIAETTLPGFQVGKTRVADPVRLTSVNYVQDPKNADVIFDANSFEVLKFY